MAQAIARGLAAGPQGSVRMLFTDSGSGRAAEIAHEVHGEALASNQELARSVDALILGCKPKDLDKVAPEASSATSILSILGATSLDALRKAFPASNVQRAMPNLPVAIGEGIVCIAEEGDRIEGLDEVLLTLGRLETVPEAAIDAATAVMGCSPAYVELFIDTLAEAGAVAGLSERLSRDLAIDAVRGTSLLAARREAGEIRRAVASPGGSTEAGLDALAGTGFAESVMAAVNASLARMRGEI